MLRHVIAPSRCYTKAAHDVLRHRRLNSDAKVLLLTVQGLPDAQADQPLSEHARTIGLTGRAYQKAKKLLVEHGYVHEWREQGDGGLWATQQFFSNVPVTAEEAARLRKEQAVGVVPPGARNPTVGEPGSRSAGGQLPVDEELGKNDPHPPSEAAPEPESEPVSAPEEPQPDVDLPPEVAEGERVLLSLRHVCRELYLGVKEARGLAELAARWLVRGVTAAELRRVLTSEMPGDGIRSAVGFLRYRLLHKLPEEVPPSVAPGNAAPPDPGPAPGPVAALVACAGPGDEHVFRSVDGQTHCGPCRQAAAWAHWEAHRAQVVAQPDHVPWRERIAANAAAGPRPQPASP